MSVTLQREATKAKAPTWYRWNGQIGDKTTLEGPLASPPSYSSPLGQTAPFISSSSGFTQMYQAPPSAPSTTLNYPSLPPPSSSTSSSSSFAPILSPFPSSAPPSSSPSVDRENELLKAKLAALSMECKRLKGLTQDAPKHNKQPASHLIYRPSSSPASNPSPSPPPPSISSSGPPPFTTHNGDLVIQASASEPRKGNEGDGKHDMVRTRNKEHVIVSTNAISYDQDTEEVCVVDLKNMEWWTVVPSPNDPLEAKEDKETYVACEDESLGDSYVLVQEGDVVDGISDFVVSTLKTYPNFRDLPPEEMKLKIHQAFDQLVKKDHGVITEAYGWARFLYSAYDWTACAYQMYNNPAVAKFVFSAVSTIASWTLVILL